MRLSEHHVHGAWKKLDASLRAENRKRREKAHQKIESLKMRRDHRFPSLSLFLKLCDGRCSNVGPLR